MDAFNRSADSFFYRLKLGSNTEHWNGFFTAVASAAPVALCLVFLIAAAILLQRRSFLGAVLVLGTAALGFLTIEGINWLIGGERVLGAGPSGAGFASPWAYLSALALFMFAAVVGSRLRR